MMLTLDISRRHQRTGGACSRWSQALTHFAPQVSLRLSMRGLRSAPTGFSQSPRGVRPSPPSRGRSCVSTPRTLARSAPQRSGGRRSSTSSPRSAGARAYPHLRTSAFPSRRMWRPCSGGGAADQSRCTGTHRRRSPKCSLCGMTVTAVAMLMMKRVGSC